MKRKRKTEMSASFVFGFSSSDVRSRFAREDHLERDEEKQQAAKNPERVDGVPMADKKPAPTSAKSSGIPCN
jgi:hypothetical protein